MEDDELYDSNVFSIPKFIVSKEAKIKPSIVFSQKEYDFEQPYYNNYSQVNQYDNVKKTELLKNSDKSFYENFRTYKKYTYPFYDDLIQILYNYNSSFVHEKNNISTIVNTNLLSKIKFKGELSYKDLDYFTILLLKNNDSFLNSKLNVKLNTQKELDDSTNKEVKKDESFDSKSNNDLSFEEDNNEVEIEKFNNEYEEIKYKQKIENLNKYSIPESYIPDAMAIRVDPYDNYMSCCFSKGTVVTYFISNKFSIASKIKVNSSNLTSIRYKKSENLSIAVGSTDKSISFWHVATGKKLFSCFLSQPILSLDYSMLSDYIAAGMNKRVSLFDDNIKTEIFSFGSDYLNGFNGRVNSVFFDKSNNKVLFAGDETGKILVFDIREKNTVKIINSSCQILGDSMSLDNNSNTIIVGSYSSKNQLTMIDLRVDREILDYNNQIIDFDFNEENSFSRKIKGSILSLSHSTNSKLFTLGCSKTNHMRIYTSDKQNNNYKLISHSDIFANPIFSTHVSDSGKYIAYCGAKSSLGLVSLN